MPAGKAGALGSFLVDGFLGGMWRITRYRDRALLRIEPVASLSKRDLDPLVEEGGRLLKLVEPDAGKHRVELVGV